MSKSTTAANLDDLIESVRAGEYTDRQMTDLPTYGGEEPESTEGVWSWDATRLLIGACPDDFHIVDREDA